jgi:hypothetical protein
VLLSAKLEGDENWYTTALLDVNPIAGIMAFSTNWLRIRGTSA